MNYPGGRVRDYLPREPGVALEMNYPGAGLEVNYPDSQGYD